MDLYEVIDQVAALLRKRGRLAYRALKVQFQLDEEQLEALKEELIEGQRVAVDEGGKVLVWAGSNHPESSVERPESEQVQDLQPKSPSQKDQFPAPSPPSPPGERRQLTVLFCD